MRFSLAFVQALTHPRVLEAIRFAQHEGERSGLGRLFYENGPRRCWLQVGEWLRAGMGVGALREADPWLCALHLKALIQCEWFEPCMWGVMAPTEDDLRGFVERAVDLFLRAYAPSEPVASAEPPKEMSAGLAQRARA